MPISISTVILAGGLGTRLHSVISDRPKVLAEVRGRPFITYLLDHLSENGIENVILCTGYRADQIKKTLGESYGALGLFYSHEKSPLGTGGALKLASSLYLSDILLVMNGDSFSEFNLLSVLEWHYSQNADVTILLTKVENTGRYGRVDLDKAGHINRFSEKCDSEGPGLINAGVYIMARDIVQSIPSGRSVSLEDDIFPALIGKGLYGFQNNGSFLDIGTPESYAEAEEFFLSLGR